MTAAPTPQTPEDLLALADPEHTQEMDDAIKRAHPADAAELLDTLDDDEVRQFGPRMENHAAFPNRTNVQFARVLARDRVEIRIWERGAGYTLASGSSSCAVAAAALVSLWFTRRLPTESLADGEVSGVEPAAAAAS